MFFLSLVLLLGLTSTSSLSFSRRFGLKRMGTRNVVNMMSDVVMDVTPKPDSKAALLSSKFSTADRGEVNSYILQLEKESPVVSNALTSEHILGSWDVLYSGSLTDPGLLLYQVAKSLPFSQISFGDLSIEINRESNATSRCSAQIGDGTNVDIVIDTQLKAAGDEGMRFKEVYSSGKIGTFNIPFPSEIFSSLTRDLVVTYLDSDLMIVRDSFGCPDILQKTKELPLIEKPPVQAGEEENQKNEIETTEQAPGDSLS